MNEVTTWSPTARPATPSPTSITSPAPSWPRTSGGGKGMVPLVADRSEWQTPQAASFTVTSPRFGPSTLMVSTTTGLFSSRQTAALPVRCIRIPPKHLRSAEYSGTRIVKRVCYSSGPRSSSRDQFHDSARQVFHQRPMGHPLLQGDDRGSSRRQRRGHGQGAG